MQASGQSGREYFRALASTRAVPGQSAEFPSQCRLAALPESGKGMSFKRVACAPFRAAAPGRRSHGEDHLLHRVLLAWELDRRAVRASRISGRAFPGERDDPGGLRGAQRRRSRGRPAPAAPLPELWSPHEGRATPAELPPGDVGRTRTRPPTRGRHRGRAGPVRVATAAHASRSSAPRRTCTPAGSSRPRTPARGDRPSAHPRRSAACRLPAPATAGLPCFACRCRSQGP